MNAAQRPGGIVDRRVDAGGLRWRVQYAGPDDAPALWLLHGTGASGHSWQPLVPLLAGRFALVVPDLPGHRDSGRLPPAAQNLPGMAAALGALSRAIGRPPALLAGHSAGAALALRAVLDGVFATVPAALPAAPPVVGFNAALRPYGGPAGPLASGLARWLSARDGLNGWLARRAGDPAAVRRLVGATGSRLDDEGLAPYARLLRDPGHLAGVLAMMGDWDLPGLWRALPGLRAPMTLCVSDGDTAVPPEQSREAVARVPGARLLRHPGRGAAAPGHLAHEEDPAWAAACIGQAWDAAAHGDGQRGT